MSMLVKSLLELGKTQLEKCGIESAETDSKILYCHLMHVKLSRLFMEYQLTLPEDQCDGYFALLDKRCTGMPLQYIIGSQEFMGMEFAVDERVLIPRPETEILVEQALGVINDYKWDGEELPGKPPKVWEVADIGCGSGAIGVSVAKLAPKVKVTCTDIDGGAIEVAKKNAAALKAEVTFAKGNLLKPLAKRFRQRRFDLILSNPPYIPSGVIPTLQPEVKDHEPIRALDGGADGLDFYRRLAEEVPEYLKKGGFLILEIGDDQREQVTEILQATGRFPAVRSKQDLAGRDRLIFAVCGD